jgi:hypothetical protein
MKRFGARPAAPPIVRRQERLPSPPLAQPVRPVHPPAHTPRPATPAPPSRSGPGPVVLQRPAPAPPPTARHVLQAAARGKVLQPAISAGFRDWSLRLNGEAEGAQNAAIRMILLDFSTNPPTRREYTANHTYPQHGPHSEAVLINGAKLALTGLHVAAGNLRLVHVEVFSRFNPCRNCAQALIAFKQWLALNATNNFAGASFDVAYTDRVYVDNNNRESAAAAVMGKEASSTALRLAGWTVTEGLVHQQIATAATLGTHADPIVLE